MKVKSNDNKHRDEQQKRVQRTTNLLCFVDRTNEGQKREVQISTAGRAMYGAIGTASTSSRIKSLNSTCKNPTANTKKEHSLGLARRTTART